MFEQSHSAVHEGAARAADPLAEFRVRNSGERIALLRQLRDAGTPVHLNAPEGGALTSNLWAVDETRARLSFSADAEHPQLQALLDADELVAVAYLESVKLQFDLDGLVLVRGAETCALQGSLPQEIYRFQRRSAYRVRPPEHASPSARLRHPSIPEMQLQLRVLDVSAGGCALWLPHDVPPLQAGTELGEVKVELDELTRFAAALSLQHVGSLGADERGVRLGCAWRPLGGAAERSLQRWIDQAQKRRRLLQRGG